MALVRTDALPNNLPVVLSSFVGRERELAELGGLLEDERLVTLTGAGGSGKTRLALQAASETLERFPDGAWWVELAPLAEAELVGATIGDALGVRPLPGVSELQACGAYLASRRALVVLDNCEHLLEACAGAAESLLTAAPEVVVPPEVHHWAAIDARLREALGDDAYKRARAEGAELSIDDALEWARRARGPRRRPAAGWASLTPTEARVAELVAKGLTNPQVGERMFITKATVKTHLAHIFKKLDVHNRAELTAQAARREDERSA